MLFAKPKRTFNRLLVVENEPLIAFDNEHVLREAGYEVVATVDSVGEAIRTLEREQIDFMLVDVDLSDGSGVTVAQAAQGRGVPLMFVTGGCPPEAAALAMACLAKPYAQRDLLASIAAVEAKLAGRPVKRPPPGLRLFR